jgi:hypothetical protein
MWSLSFFLGKLLERWNASGAHPFNELEEELTLLPIFKLIEVFHFALSLTPGAVLTIRCGWPDNENETDWPKPWPRPLSLRQCLPLATRMILSTSNTRRISTKKKESIVSKGSKNGR